MAKCGCKEEKFAIELCHFHWNVTMIKMMLHDCRQWEAHGPLRSDDPADKIVLDFYDQLVYWAAKGIGDDGVVKTIR